MLSTQPSHRNRRDVDDASQIVSRVTALTFSPDGKLLATGSGEPSRSGQFKLWRVEDGAFVREVVNPHTDMILGLDFSPQGDRLVSASVLVRLTSCFQPPRVTMGMPLSPVDKMASCVCGKERKATRCISSIPKSES